MCDERTQDEQSKFLGGAGAISRRGLGVLSMAALAACAASPANAAEVAERDVAIATPDGNADCHFAHPASGRAPGVIVWPDIMGLRPAYRMMGKRLAQSGYAVLTVNQYYRAAPSPVVREGESFANPETRARLMALRAGLTPQITATDAVAFVAFLDAQASVDTARKMGVTGYCMGGPMTLQTAAAAPARIGAVASFHGAGLATDSPDSPHLLIQRIRASALIAIAQNDDAADPAAKDTLRAAFQAAGLAAEIEVYAAQHGWCALDAPVYNEAEAERAWGRLLALFAAAL